MPAGAWTYEVDNDLPAVQSLGAGATLTDTVTVTSLDGTTQDITITVDWARTMCFSGDLSGSVVEEMATVC